jgi:UDP-glucuronate 4-epimerase
VAKRVKFLVTGAAGFIGFHTARFLLERGDEVVGLDNLNDYYDPALKQTRVDILKAHSCFRFVKADLADRAAVESVFLEGKFQRVVHLGAQAGVRYSLENPHAYVQSNIVGFMQVLEGCRRSKIEHLVYASTSSVYGANTRMPFAEDHTADHPITLYAATKRANELMAHSYSSLYGLPTTGLRFFTVYGPWGRPDMALFRFTKNILAGLPIDVYNDGEHQRDFTYIDDIVKGVVSAADHIATPDASWDSDHPNPSTSSAPFRIYNIGNQSPVALTRYIEVLEQSLGKTAHKNLLPRQPGDLADTWADVEALARDVGYRPSTDLDRGVKQFVEWYLAYYHPKS